MLWGALADRQDGLALLAMVHADMMARAGRAGAAQARRFVRDYEPPSEQLAADLEEAGEERAPARATDPQERAEQIMAAVRAFGGEVG